ncbi:hypothetical protein BJ944DRAFT_57317 [Cunninghamella echinulata]|nr:hypothetical protein BJ944DRAFT_57317 [Cunninghamella echinulata]
MCSAAANYTLFVAIFTFIIPIFLVLFPWLYENKNKFKRCGKFFLKPRTNLIFAIAYFILWATAGIAISVYAFNPNSCTLDPNQKSDNYSSSWNAQCNIAKVAMGFVWFDCLLWLISLLFATFIFWKQKHLVQKNLKQVNMNTQQTIDLETEIIDHSNNNDNMGADDTIHNNVNENDHHVQENYQHEESYQHQENYQSHPQQHYSHDSSINNMNQINYHHQQQQQQQQINHVSSYEPHHFQSAAPYNVSSSSFHPPPPQHYPTNNTPTQPMMYHSQSMSPPYSQQQQQYYDESPQNQTLLSPSATPLATMPDPQNYRKQHRVV